MKNDVNLEIFNNNFFIKKVAEMFAEMDYNGSESSSVMSLIKDIDNISDGNYQKQFNEMFSFKKENEFGESDKMLTHYEISLTDEPNKKMYINIGKDDYLTKSDQKIIEMSPNSFYLNHDNGLFYDIRLYNDSLAYENSNHEYYSMLTNYDRVLNPQYYMENGNADLDMYGNHDYDNENEEIVLNVDDKYFNRDLQIVADKLNKDLKKEEQINFDDSESKYSKNNVKDLLDYLTLDVYSPDEVAECISGIKPETYLFLWNHLTKFNSFSDNNFTVVDLWDVIPEKYQENIISAMTDQNVLRFNNNVNFVELKAPSLGKEDDEVIFMVISNEESEKGVTRIFKDKKEGEIYYYDNSKNKDLRIPF